MSTRASAGPGGGARLGIWQLMLLLVTTAVIQDSSTVDHWLARLVGVHAWLPVVLALPLALGGVSLLVALADRHPHRDLAGILRELLGPLAYPLVLLIALVFVADAALTLREFGLASGELGFWGFTPFWVFATGMALVAVYGAFLGIEVLARVNSFVLLFMELPIGLLFTLFTVNHERLVRLLPLLPRGFAPVLRGTWLMLGVFGQFLLLLVLLAEVHGGRGRAGQVARRGVLLISAIALGHSVGPALTFGPSVRVINWPLYGQVRSIFLARFIANVDWMVVMLWVHGFLIEVALFVYAAARLLTTLFALRSPRTLIPGLGALALAGSFVVGTTAEMMLRRRWYEDAYALVALGWLLPLLLLGISLLRGHRRQPAPAPGGPSAGALPAAALEQGSRESAG